MYGAAREVSALTGRPLHDDVMTVLDRRPVTITPDADFAAIVIDAPDLCLRYSAALIEGVRAGPSPMWMQQRLQRAGMRPINNVVDVTNYVMLELGQPLHAFDYDLLRQRASEADQRGTPNGVPPGGRRPHIIMRRAHRGERMQTLDGVDRQLDLEMLMITDIAGAVAVGGVMGGAETEVSRRDDRDSARICELQLPEHPPDEPDARPAQRGGQPVRQAGGPGADRQGAGPCVPVARRAVGRHGASGLCRQLPGQAAAEARRADPAYVDRLLGITIPAEEQPASCAAWISA